MRKTKFHIVAILLATMLMLTAFAAPALVGDTASGIDIQITPPTGWTNRDANVLITITDTTGNGFARAMVKGEGDWTDITAELEQQGREYTAVMTTSDNCLVIVDVTGWDGELYEESRYAACFDRTAPVLRTSFTSTALHVKATDNLSGVAAVYVDGRKYLTDGEVDVPLKDLGAAVSVQAEDNVGNRSETVTVTKPSDPPPPVTTTPAVSKPAATVPATTTATPPKKDGSTAPEEPDKNSSSGAALTPDGNMTLKDDISGATSDEKQFITVTTKNGNYFYLIVDRADDGEENVHFLNQVDEADLLSLMEDGTASPAVCSCSDKCQAGAVNTACAVCAVDMTQCAGKELLPQEPDTEPDPDPAPDPDPEPEPKRTSKNGILVVVLLVALAGGGAAYFLKFKKNKPDTKGSADLDDYDYGDEDEENEDDSDAEDEEA